MENSGASGGCHTRLVRLFFGWTDYEKSNQSKIEDKSISGHSSHERSRSKGEKDAPLARSVRSSVFIAA
jgi:hypothetical protein